MSRWRIRNGSRETVRELFIRMAMKKRSPVASAALEGLDRFLDARIPTLARELMQFWLDQQQAVSVLEIQRWIENNAAFLDAIVELRGDYERLCSAGALATAWREAAKTGAGASALFLDAILRERDVSKAGVTKNDYDPYSDSIPEWIQDHGAQLVVEITEGQREAIRTAVMQGYEQRMSVPQVAAAIRPMIGLTTRQIRANLNYYAIKDSQFDAL